jgi:hypothetical protein
MNKSGRLYCNDTSDDSVMGQTFVIRGPSQSPARSIKTIERPQILDLALNLTDLSTAMSRELKFESLYISTGPLEPKSPQTNKDESEDALRTYSYKPNS